MRYLAAIVTVFLIPHNGFCANIFFDDFATFYQSKWGDAVNVPVSLGKPQIIGPVVDGNVSPSRNGLFLNSTMNDNEVRAIGLLQSIPGNMPLEIEVGFVPRTGGIDGALQLWITTPTPGKNLIMNIFAADYGERRFVSSDYNLAMNQIMGSTSNYRQLTGGVWNYDTYYRYLFQIGNTTTRIELQTDSRSTIWSVNYPIGITNYFGSDLRVNLGQFMYIPHRLSEARVMVDSVRVTQVPEPPSIVACFCGIIALLTFRRTPTGTI
jgi:hypothetical protein